MYAVDSIKQKVMPNFQQDDLQAVGDYLLPYTGWLGQALKSNYCHDGSWGKRQSVLI